MKSSLSLGLLLGLALSQVAASCPDSCPDTEDVVWALGGGCNVFRNKCYFDKENCHRKPVNKLFSFDHHHQGGVPKTMR
ncbi:uncharacterized protein LOC120452031 isoform X2 [Drosophila santomea]|uniref:uncharacterized protein LOC120452031 isoform X2 n=1 Tax=Drosophila santomea TaxID=129105 RepID=UPI0019542D7B|nr:uncharacterized protein LOC120452031 isoform X2 [Drosophila santomea]